MERLTEIEKRLADIQPELENEDANLDELETEIKTLQEERKAINDKIEKRNALKEEVSKNAVVVKEFKEERKDKSMDFEKMTQEDIISTPEYRNAYLKRLMGRELNEIEKRTIAVADMDAVPTQTAQQIDTILRQYVPLVNEIQLFNVPGNLKFGVEETNNAAEIHTENALITGAADTVGSVSLAGFEIVKLVSISATIKAMAIPAFESWLVGILAENIGDLVENYIINGTGSSQPKGLDYYRTWTDTTTAVDWGAAAPTLAEIREQAGLLGGKYYKRAKWLCSHATYFGTIQVNKADSTDMIFTTSGDKHYIMGKEVLFSDKVRAGDLFLCDFKKVVGNFAEPVNVKSSAESGFRYNNIDYRGACLFDCDCLDANCVVKGAATITAGA